MYQSACTMMGMAQERRNQGNRIIICRSKTLRKKKMHTVRLAFEGNQREDGACWDNYWANVEFHLTFNS